ncbi:unnamed protein product [Trifolium pratense]|uniref:Uncharacterized protein n=1 Tax=Trifolium pratense TaxID=57577 RepID=A0ACB0L0A5_TRIPR|nr:unnamed protein product [Trifolium pratense]
MLMAVQAASSSDAISLRRSRPPVMALVLELTVVGSWRSGPPVYFVRLVCDGFGRQEHYRRLFYWRNVAASWPPLNPHFLAVFASS